MLDFIGSLADIMATAVNSFLDYLDNLIHTIGLIIKSFVTLSAVVEYLPSFVGPFISIFIAYIVVINIVNLGG